MIARVWEGIVPLGKADAYAQYLGGAFGVEDYRRIPGNRGATLLRRDVGEEAHFLFVSLWASWEAIKAYAGPEPEKARYYPFDLECLRDPSPTVRHYEVLAEVRGA
jgi:heme-degrading monooxygenase HmoA